MRLALMMTLLVACSSKDERVDKLMERVEALEKSEAALRGQLSQKLDVLVQNLKFSGVVGADGKPIVAWWCGATGCSRNEAACQHGENLAATEQRTGAAPAKCEPYGFAYCRSVRTGADVLTLCERTLDECERSNREALKPGELCTMVR